MPPKVRVTASPRHNELAEVVVLLDVLVVEEFQKSRHAGVTPALHDGDDPRDDRIAPRLVDHLGMVERDVIRDVREQGGKLDQCPIECPQEAIFELGPPKCRRCADQGSVNTSPQISRTRPT